MKKLTKKQTFDLVSRGVPRYLMGSPTVVSFELTSSCNANCRHCNRGGIRQGDEKLIGPGDCRRLMRQLKPIIVQLSGGEPLLRDDLVEMIQAVKPSGQSLPYLILVTNGWLLTKEKYLAFREAGVDQFSVSLCFPDERHDKWRRADGLYAHLEKTIPALAALGHDDIVLNCAITRENLPHIMDLVQTAERWGVSISFSAYSILRTGERKYTIESGEDLALLRKQFDLLKNYKQTHCGAVLNADFNIDSTFDFFKFQEIKGCSAGHRFLVVTSDGYLKPCSMHAKNYTSHRQIKREFVPFNDCGGCYVSIRSYLDRSLAGLLKEYIAAYSLGSRKNGSSVHAACRVEN